MVRNSDSFYEDTTNDVDQFADTLKPKEYDEYVAIQSSGDGSCFFNSASILKVGNESLSNLFRLATAIELFLNAGKYVPSCINVTSRITPQIKGNFVCRHAGHEEWPR